MTMLTNLVLGLLTVGALVDTVVINEAVDKLLDSVNSVLAGEGQNKIPLDDLIWDSTTKKSGVWHLVFFKASGGLVQDLATLKRTDDAYEDVYLKRLIASLSFSSFSLEYGHYDFELMSIKSNGSIYISLPENEVTAAIDVVREGSKCSAKLIHAGLQNGGPPEKVAISGPQVLNQFLTTVLIKLLNQDKFGSKLFKTINQKLMDAFQEGLEKTDLCALLH